ncbi:hypothetical protein GUG71_21325 [Xanthomonas citri pv. citri]|nr:hypothetical protein [Xanthomonas citri pv. citri]
MGLALPGQAREAIAAGHAALITATGAFGDFFTSARELSTVTEQTRAQLRGRGCTVHTADGATLETAPDTTPRPRAAGTPAPVGRED